MKITANRLTLLRIILLPLPCLLLYGGPSAKLTAVGIGSLLGLTDYFDGLLARRQGVTRLGAFLDPVADKVFIAAIYLFLVKLGFLPLWLVLGLLMREFLVATLRTRVPGSLPVTWWAKVKTTCQMLVAALIIALAAYPAHALWFYLLAAAFLGLGAFWVKLERKYRGVLLAFSLLLPGYSLLSPPQQFLWLGLLALLVTWFSAWPYLRQGLVYLKRKEMGEVLAAVAFPAFIVLLLGRSGSGWFLVPLIIALEFLKEGLRLLAARKDFGPAWLLAALSLFAYFLPPGLVSAYLAVIFIYQASEVLKCFWEKRSDLLG